jgi:hypothetical protein
MFDVNYAHLWMLAMLAVMAFAFAKLPQLRHRQHATWHGFTALPQRMAAQQALKALLYLLVCSNAYLTKHER